MADAVTLRGEQLLIKVGDGGDPETFAHPCLINTDRGISFTTQNNSVVIPDCANPTAVAFQRTIKESVGCEITGSGTLHIPNVSDYMDWVLSPDSKNVQVVVGDPTGPNGGYVSGAFDLTQFEITGSRGNVAECSISLSSNGAFTFTAHA